MHSLITFATQWGSKYGGINSFNADFLSAFGFAYYSHVQIICIVSSAEEKEIEDAKNCHVTLLKLPYAPEDRIFTSAHADAAIAQLQTQSIIFDPAYTVWLGHDRISGEAAIHAAKKAGGRSALIHHMSYDAYESFAENSHSAYSKTQNQKRLFKKADIVLAVGPLLRNALAELLDISKDQVHMIVPGLAEIEPRKTTPTTFSAFISGRLSDDAAKIKQGHLGIAAFAHAISQAKKNNSPENLVNRSRIVLRGVDFESRHNYSGYQSNHSPENDLHAFAEKHAGGIINLQALPYTQDRDELYDNLKSASVALMPSWHEGFGLVAWEAIAARVPLIMSKDSGVYELLREVCGGTEDGFVKVIRIKGTNQPPYFSNEDLNEVAEAIKEIAINPEIARSRAARLRSSLDEFTWTACVEKVVKHFSWDLQKGSIKRNTIESTESGEKKSDTKRADQHYPNEQSPLHMPVKYWKPGRGMAESQLLRADEALVPFDPGRLPIISELDNWLDNSQWLHAIRLITGAGGLGKTRLAIELCQQRLGKNWHCGFLEKNYIAKDMAAVWQSLLDINKPILLVIDYAETRQMVLLALIKAMLGKPGENPARLLLLARDGGEWWDNLPSRNAECEMLLSGYATSGPFVLPELYTDQNSRAEAYLTALQVYANAIGADIPDVKPDFTGEHFSKPLYLQMAALLALYGERPATAEGLTKALLNHERRYWIEALADSGLHKPENYAQQLLALTTLTGGFATSKEAKKYWDIASDDNLIHGQFNALFNALLPLYPGNHGLHAVQPDLLGEALVTQALLRSQGEKLLDAVLGNIADPSFQHHAITVIARLSVHRPDLQYILTSSLEKNFHHCCREIINVAIETPSDLPSLAQSAFMVLPFNMKSQVAGILRSLLKDESVELAHLAQEIYFFETDKFRIKLQKKPNDINTLSDYANSLYYFAIALYRAGHNDKALNIAKLSLDIYQRLAHKYPTRFESDYAASLNNYGNRLGNLDLDEDSIPITKQAVDIYHRLNEKYPGKYEHQYAASLNNYGNCLNKIKVDEECVFIAKQAMELYQRLCDKDPDEFNPNYSTSLINYAISLSNIGQNDNAVSLAEKALNITKELVQNNPDRFDLQYSFVLSAYADLLIDIGRNEEALNFSKQAYIINQRLTQKNPVRYELYSFTNFFNMLFINWLVDETSANIKREEIKNIPINITPHKKAALQFLSLFVQACISVESTQKEELFKQAVLIWSDLSQAGQNDFQGNFLCICGWLNQYKPAFIPDNEWQDYWSKFYKQRYGNLPIWMQTIAKRLDFAWPEVTLC